MKEEWDPEGEQSVALQSLTLTVGVSEDPIKAYVLTRRAPVALTAIAPVYEIKLDKNSALSSSFLSFDFADPLGKEVNEGVVDLEFTPDGIQISVSANELPLVVSYQVIEDSDYTGFGTIIFEFDGEAAFNMMDS